MALIGIIGILKSICQQRKHSHIKKKKPKHSSKLLANKIHGIQLAISHVHVAFMTGKFQYQLHDTIPYCKCTTVCSSRASAAGWEATLDVLLRNQTCRIRRRSARALGWSHVQQHGRVFYVGVNLGFHWAEFFPYSKPGKNDVVFFSR